MAALSQEVIADRMREVPRWEHRDGALRRELRFSDFSEAWGFMARVALVAEKLDHHPDWSNSWNTVQLAVASHAAGGVTEQCFAFAAAVDSLLGE